MNKNVIEVTAKNLNISIKKVEVVLDLLSQGNTVPFIARYRKELTGGLDEEVIHAIEKEFDYSNNLYERKEQVIRLIDEKGLLTDELKANILACTKLVDVEDIYLPFKEKRHTLATIAKENGLEPLAKLIMLQKEFDLESEASNYLNEKISSKKDAIIGALNIISEIISEDVKIRKSIRNYIYKTGILESKISKKAVDENEIYKIYYEFNSKLLELKDYRVLAINRGEKEKVLNVKIRVDNDELFKIIEKSYIKNSSLSYINYLNLAIEDSIKRLIFPSLEREIRGDLTLKSQNSAIKVFSLNLEQLLMQSPLKTMRILGVDPAFRTGCKLAVINELGDLCHIDKVFLDKSFDMIAEIVKEYKIDLIAIGNGTASRETEQEICNVIAKYKLDVKYLIVNEAGASVYSASKIARDEFPDLAVEERSAVSIARRVQDPLAELVKIDSKSIGVGQYQHDVNQKQLQGELDFVVEKVVNNVGVDLNVASPTILSHISGITPRIAKSIVDYRRKNGRFNERNELLNVSYFGDKSFVQAAGFLRILDGKNILEETSIHPESYELTNQILSSYGLDLSKINTEEFNEEISKLNIKKLATEFNSDEYTVGDVIDALQKPRRDPRDSRPAPILRSDVLKIEDLSIGLEIEGVVVNVVDFGVFVDIGIKNSALVHISKLSDKFVKHPLDVVNLGDIVKVTVIDFDVVKGKVSCSMI